MIIILEIVFLIVLIAAYIKTKKTAKKVEELLNETEAYTFAVKHIAEKQEREHMDALKQAQMLKRMDDLRQAERLHDLNKQTEDINGKSV